MEYMIGSLGTLLAMFAGAYIYFKAGRGESPVTTLPKPKHKAMRAKRDEEIED